jgi:hypothetical protein
MPVMGWGSILVFLGLRSLPGPLYILCHIIRVEPDVP